MKFLPYLLIWIQFYNINVTSFRSPIKGISQVKLVQHIRTGKIDNSDRDIGISSPQSLQERSKTTTFGTNESKEKENENSMNKFIVPLGLAGLAGLVYTAGNFIDFNQILDACVDKVEELGPIGYLYFALVYIAAEILAVPAAPLTASSGYLFGLVPGTLIVLSSATIAAAISFYIGRTYLRTWAQNFIQESPTWRAVDKAIGKQGFKVVLLLRLSPLLPFALSNYLYAVTSVDFASFISATFFGFAPGSFGFVYFGTAGKAIFGDGEGPSPSSLPWYVYAGIGAAVILAGQTIAKVATDAIKEIDPEADFDIKKRDKF